MIELTKLEKPKILKNKAEKWKEELEIIENPSEALKKRYNHKEIKEALLEETSMKCAYCESKILHVTYGHIEHILPKSIFIEKTFEWENLTLACNKCNINKGDYFDKTYSILNPYIDKVEEHINIKGPLIVAKTRKGQISINKLDLNRMELIERRQESIQSLNQLQINYKEETNDVIKDMFYQEIKQYMKISTEYYGTLIAMSDLVEVG